MVGSRGRGSDTAIETAAALVARLRQVAPHFPGGAWLAELAGDRLPSALARSVRQSGSDEALWLAIVAFTTVFPTIGEHQAVRRALALASADDALPALLGAVSPLARRARFPDAAIEVVAGATIVDANFAGRFDHNTGVQRVLRETASRWNATRPITLACWNDASTGMRRLVGREIDRVTTWATHSALSVDERARPDAADPARDVLLVPVRSVIVEIEVAQTEIAAELAALAAVSGNRVAVVGHDMIPIVSAENQASDEIERFARFLTVVKHSDRVAGVSASAAEEFRGFARAVGAQGLRGPDVVAVPLAMNAPTEAVDAAASTRPAPAAALATPAGAPPAAPPLVLVVGSQEARKNHDAILSAAVAVRQGGVPFRLRFIGGGGSAELHRMNTDLARARSVGLDVELLTRASDQVLLESYRSARFTVFPSLHEGFGLPVAESLALGVPVVTSDHGSLAEIAEGGGCLVVDARDDAALARAMRSLLTDDALHARLVAEAAARTFRTWDDYSDELWHALVEPLAASIEGTPATDASTRPAEMPPATGPSKGDSSSAGSGALIAAWLSAQNAAVAAERARERSVRHQAARVVALARFFAATSREMGLAPAGRAAVRVIRRRLGK